MEETFWNWSTKRLVTGKLTRKTLSDFGRQLVKIKFFWGV